MGAAVLEVEQRCGVLARQHQFVQACGTAAWPDDTLAAQYGFRHAFYHEVFYERVLGARRVQLHCQIGLRLEAGYGPHARDIAAELAMHFVQGREAQRAVQYLRLAGENALRWCALPLGPMRCGASATRRKPCGGARRRCPWPRRWPTPRVWRSPTTGRPSCLTADARHRRSRRTPTPS
jgi:hypothetical protein